MSSPGNAPPIPTIAAALLRTAAWLYAALWVTVAATAPWGPPGLLPVVVLAPLGPVVFVAVMHTMRRPPRRSAIAPPPPPPHAPVERAASFLSSPWAEPRSVTAPD